MSGPVVQWSRPTFMLLISWCLCITPVRTQWEAWVVQWSSGPDLLSCFSYQLLSVFHLIPTDHQRLSERNKMTRGAYTTFSTCLLWWMFIISMTRMRGMLFKRGMTSEKDTAFEEHARGSGPLDHWTTCSTHWVCIDFMHAHTKSCTFWGISQSHFDHETRSSNLA